MKPDQKHKVQEKTTDKAGADLAAKKVQAAQADQVRGGLGRRLPRGDEGPSE
jgi:hypothetical protein